MQKQKCKSTEFWRMLAWISIKMLNIITPIKMLNVTTTLEIFPKRERRLFLFVWFQSHSTQSSSIDKWCFWPQITENLTHSEYQVELSCHITSLEGGAVDINNTEDYVSGILLIFTFKFQVAAVTPGIIQQYLFIQQIFMYIPGTVFCLF